MQYVYMSFMYVCMQIYICILNTYITLIYIKCIDKGAMSLLSVVALLNIVYCI